MDSHAQERLIRKYSNRRLYDTGGQPPRHARGSAPIHRAGERIKVVDDKSGDDLTRSVLLQIIAEQEQFGTPVLGTELLEMIIRFYGRPMQAMLSGYLEQAFTAHAAAAGGNAVGNGQGVAGAVRTVDRARPQEHRDVGADAGRDPRRFTAGARRQAASSETDDSGAPDPASGQRRQEERQVMTIMDIRNKTVVVTGAGRGIGRAIALQLAERGADLALFDLE